MEEIEEMQKMGLIWFDMVRCRFELHRNKPGFRMLSISCDFTYPHSAEARAKM